MRVPFLVLACLGAAVAWADPMSQSQPVDFFREVSSRKLEGLAARSDGRLVAGPTIKSLTGDLPADLIWTAVPRDANHWWLGTGPDGKILEASFDWKAATFTTREVAMLADGQVFALASLPKGRLLAGTSPLGTLNLVAKGETLASIRLPADSVLDLLSLPNGDVLVATGNPGRIYRVDTDAFAKAGVAAETVATPEALAKAGVTEFGRIRDRNVRRLFREASGRILAGSAPDGRIYAFNADGGEPIVLFEQERAEVTDFHLGPDGDIYAALVVDADTARVRVVRAPAKPSDGEAEDAPADSSEAAPAFTGRSMLLRLPADGGLPDTVVARNNVALYELATHGKQLVMAGGDTGELTGYDPVDRRSLTYPGSTAAQVLQILPLDAGRFALVQNNPAGFAILDFDGTTPRTAETRRIDLRKTATLGAVRIDRLRGLTPQDLSLSIRANRIDDELEGWTPWTTLAWQDGGYLPTEPVVGRYVQLKLAAPADTDDASPIEIDRAALFHLPLNQRPRLQAFRILSPNFGLLARREPSTPPSVTTLGQVIGQSRRGESDGDESRSSAALLGSPVVNQPFAQIVHWTVDDPDNDNLEASFAVRRDGTDTWEQLSIANTDGFVQFDRRQLTDGLYFTRLTIREQAPRPPGDRQSVVFETDDLLIDNTPPAIETATATRQGENVIVSIRGRDELSGLAGVELTFNNGHTVTLEQPADGILDQWAETFATEIPDAQLAGATAVEILLYDDAGNHAARRVAIPVK